MLATAIKISIEEKLHGKRGVTPHVSQRKLNKTKPIEVIYTAINSKSESRKHKELKQSQHNCATISMLL